MAGIYDKLKVAFGPGFGVVASRLFNLLPVGGFLDYTVVRAGVNATLTNSSGSVVTVGANVPRADFEDFACSVLLTEKTATNLYLNTATLSTQGITTTAASHTVSMYGSGTITFTGTYSGSLVGVDASTRVSITFTATAGTLTSTVSGSVTNAQAELNNYATSYVASAGAPGVRAKDEVDGYIDASYFDSENGILFLHTYMYPELSADTVISLNVDETDNFRVLKKLADSTTIHAERYDSGIDTALSYAPNSLQEYNKIALKYSSAGMELWVNGVLRDSATGNTLPAAGTIEKIDFHDGAAVGTKHYNGKTLETWYSDDLTIDLEIETSYVSLADLRSNFQYTVIS